MSLRGQCIICYSAFTPTNVSALPCGHTFHEQCISEWLDTPGHACPNCRRKCSAKDVIRIFFENGGEEALPAKNKVLQARLNDVAHDATSMLHDVNKTKSENQVLNQQFEARDRYKDSIREASLCVIEAYINARGDSSSGQCMKLQSQSSSACPRQVLPSGLHTQSTASFRTQPSGMKSSPHHSGPALLKALKERGRQMIQRDQREEEEDETGFVFDVRMQDSSSGDHVPSVHSMRRLQDENRTLTRDLNRCKQDNSRLEQQATRNDDKHRQEMRTHRDGLQKSWEEFKVRLVNEHQRERSQYELEIKNLQRVLDDTRRELSEAQTKVHEFNLRQENMKHAVLQFREGVEDMFLKIAPERSIPPQTLSVPTRYRSTSISGPGPSVSNKENDARFDDPANKREHLTQVLTEAVKRINHRRSGLGG